MTRRITPQTTLDNLKKEAKRWLKALRANHAEARNRFASVYPKASTNPVLRDVQHAIALEFGHTDWASLKRALDNRPAVESRVEDTHTELVARFLEYACPDHHVRGRPAHRIARHAAVRILEQHPEIARDSLDAAVVCGESDAVQRILHEQPELASGRSSSTALDRSAAGGAGDIFKDIGPKGWEPLLYLCFTRLPLDRSNDHAVSIARILLDHGANPNAYFMAGDSRYTPLVGVIGEGEEDRPPHPQREPLARLLLQRGAEPYDTQVIYNIHFHGKILWYLKLMYEFSVEAGRQADWDDPEWHMLDMGGYGSGARWHLWIAVQHNDLELAEWCLEHGANPNVGPPRAETLPQHSLYEQAVRAGRTEMAALLIRYGAVSTSVVVEGAGGFVAACLRLDRAEAERRLIENPEYLRSQEAMWAAVREDRADVVEFLFALGLPIDVEYDRKQRPLHLAAAHNAVKVAKLLIDRGAEIDPIEMNWNNTPMDFAVWHEYPRMIQLLSPYTRNVGGLVFTGNVERLRELFRTDPELGKSTSDSSPLFWLPEDERKAVEIIELLLAHGTDASVRRKQDGMTAADVARRRGLVEAANRLATAASPEVAKYERLAGDIVSAYATGDADAMQRINEHYRRSFTAEDLRALVWRLIYKVRRAGGAAHAFGIAEARELISRRSGFPNWTTLTQAAAKGAPPPGDAYTIDPQENRIAPRRDLTAKEWDGLIAVMKDRRIPSLIANGMMTDDVLKQVSQLEFVTSLNLSGSRQLTHDGLQHLARMPQLQHLELMDLGAKLTDRGLDVLRHLPRLRSLLMCWQGGISDTGVSNLRFCDEIETVDLMGTPTGDGVIQALRGKPKLRHFKTGKLVTDAGLPFLHEFPMFNTRHDGEFRCDLMGASVQPNSLLIDGPFTNAGLATLAGLDGLFALDLFWHISGITSDGFAALAGLTNLHHLGCDGKLSDNEAMRHIAAMPRLRRLRAQGTTATDDGFVALSRSSTLEYFWGRECPNLTGRGFLAFSKLPSLRGIGVSCKNVDDEALSVLPHFPSLRQLMPMDVPDNGFRHVGRCEQLEDLWCMYCRDTSDAATEHIAGLRLKTYYAGLTQITDRSLELLGRMTSLELIELYETKSVTDAGLAYLAVLPRLREVRLSGLPHVTLEGTKVFPARVRVNYWL